MGEAATRVVVVVGNVVVVLVVVVERSVVVGATVEVVARIRVVVTCSVVVVAKTAASNSGVDATTPPVQPKATRLPKPTMLSDAIHLRMRQSENECGVSAKTNDLRL